MSNSRHTSEADVRGYAVTHPAGRIDMTRELGWDQLVYAEHGVMRVETIDSTWTVPAHRAVWIPDGERVLVSNTSPIALRNLYFRESLRALPGGVRTVNVTPLARELILHAVRSSPLFGEVPVDGALIVVLLDQLRRLPVEPLQLPWPQDPRAVSAARMLMERPGGTLAEVLKIVPASRRTLERAFVSETGLSLGAWRRRAGILDSLVSLTAGSSVTDAAAAAGYSTPSAFVAAFRRELGTTPRDYVSR